MAFKPQFIKSKCGNTTFFSKYPIPKMLKIAVYTFNASSDVIPTFNTDFKNYKIKDVANSNGTITRTISSYELPTTINFSSKSALLSVEYLDTSNVTNMKNIFHSCTLLATINTSNWNTGKVTDMSYMFYNCTSLTSLDLSSFDTSKVADMSYMFYECTSLTSLDLSGWDTSKVTETTNMFSGVPTTINWNYDGTNYTNFNLTEEKTGYSGTFPWNIQKTESYIEYTLSGDSEFYLDYEGINELYELPAKPNLPALYTDENTFSYNYNSIEITKKDGTVTSNAHVLTGDIQKVKVFYNLEDVMMIRFLNADDGDADVLDPYITTVDYLDITGLTSFNSMFESCYKLTYVNTEGWDTSNITDMTSTFAYCYSLASADFISNWDVSNVTSFGNMFSRCCDLTSLDLSNWVTSSAKRMYYMFFDCGNLTSLDLSNFDTRNLENGWFGYDGMFRDTPISNWNYDGTNYTNWTLSEEDTSYSGTFPWNQLPELYVEYTVTSDFNTRQLNDTTGDGIYPNLPALVINGNTTYNYDSKHIEITKNDNTVTNDLSTPLSQIKKVKIYYREDVTSLRFNMSGIPGSMPGATGSMEGETEKYPYIKEIIHLDIDNFNSFENMFYECYYLETVNGIENWNTSNVTNMSGMFALCSSLKGDLNLSGWDVSNVTDMSQLFGTYGSELTSLNLTGWDTRNVTNMSYMFEYFICENKINGLSNFNTGNVTDMSYMFAGSKAATTNVDGVILAWDVRNVTNMSYMFSNSKLVSITLTNWDAINVTDMSYMFSDAKASLFSLSGFNTSKVTNMTGMFINMDLATPPSGLTEFNTSNVTNMSHMFENVKIATAELDLSNWNTSKVTNMEEMFKNLNLIGINLSNWNTSKVTSMSNMFKDFSVIDWCYDGTNYNNWTLTESATSYSGTFPWNLDVIAIYTFDSSINTLPTFILKNPYVNDEYSTFSYRTIDSTNNGITTRIIVANSDARPYGISFENRTGLLTVEYLDTEGAILESGILNLFNGCSSLKSVKGIRTSCHGLSNMFYNCTSLTDVDLTNVYCSSSCNVGYMFYNCTSLKKLNLSTWNLKKEVGTTTLDMFKNIPSDIDWCYDGTNYTNWNVSEEDTGYSGTFPWNVIKPYIEYKIVSSSRTLDPNSEYFFPRVYNNISEHTEYIIGKNVTIYKKDGTTTTNIPSVIASDVEKIHIEYDYDTTWQIMFQGSYDDGHAITELLEITDMSNIKSMDNMFALCNNLTRVNGTGWDTSKVATMRYTFNMCHALTTIDGITNWNTSNVTDMTTAFGMCIGLTTLDLSGWDTSKVTDISYMFRNCTNLTLLNISSFNTRNVQTSYDMLFNIPKTINWGYAGTSTYANWTLAETDTNYEGTFPWNNILYVEYTVNNYSRIFEYGMYDTEYYYYLPIFITETGEYQPSDGTGVYIKTENDELLSLKTDSGLISNVESYNPKSIVVKYGNDVIGLKFPNAANDAKYSSITTCLYMDTKNFTTMKDMFFYSGYLTYVNTSCFDTSKVTNMRSMFSNCDSLASLDLSSWNTGQVNNTASMFYRCSSLTSLDLSKFNTSNVTDMKYMFYNCSSLTSLDLSKFNTSEVTNMISMFYECTSLKSINLSSFDTSKVTDMNSMFYNCTSLTSLDLSKFNTSKVTNMS